MKLHTSEQYVHSEQFLTWNETTYPERKVNTLVRKWVMYISFFPTSEVHTQKNYTESNRLFWPHVLEHCLSARKQVLPMNSWQITKSLGINEKLMVYINPQIYFFRNIFRLKRSRNDLNVAEHDIHYQCFYTQTAMLLSLWYCWDFVVPKFRPVINKFINSSFWMKLKVSLSTWDIFTQNCTMLQFI
jgi:hypothetical protein